MSGNYSEMLLEHRAHISIEDKSAIRQDARVWLGDRALDVTIAKPIDGVTQPETLVFVPGVVAKRSMYAPVAAEMMKQGFQTVLMGHQGGGPLTRHELVELDRELLEGGLADHVTGELVLVGHSLGGPRSVIAAEDAHKDGLNISRIVLEASAGFHGVRPLMAIPSIALEMRQMGRERNEDRLAVGAEGIAYMARSGLAVQIREFRYAATRNIEDRARALIESGVRITAVTHPQDILIDTSEAQKGMIKAGIESFTPVEGGHAGHIAQLTNPNLASQAIRQAVFDSRSPNRQLRRAS